MFIHIFMFLTLFIPLWDPSFHLVSFFFFGKLLLLTSFSIIYNLCLLVTNADFFYLNFIKILFFRVV